jgi:hypothetical protein
VGLGGRWKLAEGGAQLGVDTEILRVESRDRQQSSNQDNRDTEVLYGMVTLPPLFHGVLTCMQLAVGKLGVGLSTASQHHG